MGTVLVIRHAETTWNREGRVQGWASTTLTDRGRRQARTLAKELGRGVEVADAGVDRIVASDLRRARETADPLATSTGCEPQFEEAWRERHYGDLQGLEVSKLFERNPHLSLKHTGEAAARARPDGGETLLETRQRVLGAWDRLCADIDTGETAVVISHSVPISLLLGWIRDESLTEAILDRQLDNGAITELRVDSRGDDAENSGYDVRLVRENWTGYRNAAVES
jgi:probable phosphoglycerate mutase